MIRPKHLDMNRIEELFNEHFTFNRDDLDKGFTRWELTPKREPKLYEEEHDDEQ